MKLTVAQTQSTEVDMSKFTDRIVSFDSLFPIGDTVPEGIEGLKLILDDDFKEPENSYDEIIPNLFIGDEFVATNIKKLQALSITHILNAAQGSSRFHYVDTDPSYYHYGWKGYQCKFLGLPSSDVPDFPICQFFGIATSFIQDALIYTKNGRILVHSLEGTSRSATIVLAYLILYRKLTAADAMKLVKRKRNILPNDGFLKQLCDLEFLVKLRPPVESETESEEDSESEEKTKSGRQGGQSNRDTKTETSKAEQYQDADGEKMGDNEEGVQDDENIGRHEEGKYEKEADGLEVRGDKEGAEIDSLGNAGKQSKADKEGTSPSGKKVRFADKPRHHHSPKSPSCKRHPDGKGTPPVTPENRCAIHGCKNRALDKKPKSEGKKSPSHPSPSCKVHGTPKRVCAIHGDVKKS